MANPIDIFTGKEADPFSALNSKYEFTLSISRAYLVQAILFSFNVTEGDNFDDDFAERLAESLHFCMMKI